MTRSGFTRSFDDVPIYFEVFGDSSPAMLFVHGWSCDKWFWSKQIDYFSPRYSVVTLDLAGHGSSGTDRSKWTTEAFAQDIVAVTRELELDEIILIGHSLAGEVVLESSLVLPDQVIGIVAVDSLTKPEEAVTDEDIEEEISSFREDFQGVVSDIVHNVFGKESDLSLQEEVRTRMQGASLEIAIPVWEEMLRYINRRYPSVFNDISAPLLIINREGKQAQEEEFRKFISDLTVIHLSGVGHFLMLEDPNAFNLILDQFVATVTLN